MFAVIFDSKLDAMKCLGFAKNLKVKFRGSDRERFVWVSSKKPMELGEMNDGSAGPIDWNNEPVFYYEGNLD